MPARKKKTVIFFPIEVGLAHVTRSLAIAQELKTRGVQVIFAIAQKRQTLIKDAGIETIPIMASLDENDLTSFDRYKDKSFILSLVREELEILKRYRPDCGVVDFRLSAIVSCAVMDIPTVYLTHSGGLPFGCYLPSLHLPKVVDNLTRSIAQKAIWRAKLAYVSTIYQAAKTLGIKYTLDRLFQRMVYIIPEIPSYLPALDHTLRRHYVGPIFWDGFNNYLPDWLKRIKPNGKTLYLTFGGTGFDRKKFLVLGELLLARGYRIIVTTGDIVDSAVFPKDPNLMVAKFLSGTKVARRVDVVVCHGGYGTMMQATLAGKPVVALPFNPEQLLHALRYEELGLGRCVYHFDPEIVLSLFRRDLKSFLFVGKNTPIQAVLTAVDDVCSNRSRFEKPIAEFCKSRPSGDPGEKAADIIEQMF